MILPLLALLVRAPVVRAEGRAEAIDLTEEQFKTYHDYLDALQDPRVEKMKPEERLIKIARDCEATGFFTTEKDAVKLGGSRRLLERLREVGAVCVVGLEAKFMDEADVALAVEARIS